jgi:hypothetical protein
VEDCGVLCWNLPRAGYCGDSTEILEAEEEEEF